MGFAQKNAKKSKIGMIQRKKEERGRGGHFIYIDSHCKPWGISRLVLSFNSVVFNLCCTLFIKLMQVSV